MPPKRFQDDFGDFTFTWVHQEGIVFSNIRAAIRRVVEQNTSISGENLLIILSRQKQVCGKWAIQWIERIIHRPTGQLVYQSQVSIYIFSRLRYLYYHNTCFLGYSTCMHDCRLCCCSSSNNLLEDRPRPHRVTTGLNGYHRHGVCPEVPENYK